MILLAVLGASATAANAQQTIFNVPSADVLGRGKVYLETDQYIRTWEPHDEDAAFFLLRGVGGVGSNVEVGLNSGPFDYLDSSTPFIDAAVKWRPVMEKFGNGDQGAFGFFAGNNLGVQVHGEDSGQVHDYAYAAGFVTLPQSKTRFSAGPYYVTDNFFGPEARFGAQVTVEQPIAKVSGLVLAADWFSGTAGYATPGIIWTIERFVLYAGYGLANDGRDNDLLTLEFGFTF
jgi:hypothetical protein